MDPDTAGRRQRLTEGFATAMTVGVALALALGDWSMLVVGVLLSVVLFAHSAGTS